MTEVYVGDLRFTEMNISYAGIPLRIMPKKPLFADGVLGRDILSQGKFEYDGQAAEFILSL